MVVKQITYQEAVELMMFGGRGDITVSMPQPLAELKPLEIRNLANAGAVFFVSDEDAIKEGKQNVDED
jgi:hypothetical protein